MRNVILWTQPNCPLCEQVKEVLSGDHLEEHPVTELITGATRNDEALAQLAMQDMAVPLVMIDGAFINPMDIIAPDEAAA